MNDKISLELTIDELMILSSIMNEALGGAQPIEEWEFDTLIGATKDEARLLQQKLLCEYKTNFPTTPQT